MGALKIVQMLDDSDKEENGGLSLRSFSSYAEGYGGSTIALAKVEA